MIDLTNGLPELGNPKNGFTRSGIHTSEYGMWLVNRQAPTPSEKQIIESVPFMQGVYDFSNILGERVYENRSLTYVFEIKQQDYERRKINQTAIENWLKKEDRKSTRLNSSHVAISSAVFCLKKKTRCAARWS